MDGREEMNILGLDPRPTVELHSAEEETERLTGHSIQLFQQVFRNVCSNKYTEEEEEEEESRRGGR